MSDYEASAGVKLFSGDAVGGSTGDIQKAALLAAAVNAMAAGNIIKWSGIPSSPVQGIDVTRVDAEDEDNNPDLHYQCAPGYQEKPSALEFEMGMDETEVSTIVDLKEEGEMHSFRVLLRSGRAWVFNGFVVDCKPAIDDKGEVKHTVSIQPSGRIYFVVAAGVTRLLGAQVLGSKTVTLTFSGTVTSTDFVAGNILLNAGGTLTPGTTVTAGASSKLLNVTATSWPTNPAGDALTLGAGPAAVRAPATVTVKAA